MAPSVPLHASDDIFYKTSFYTLIAALAILTVSSILISYSAVTALQILTTERWIDCYIKWVRIQYTTIHTIRYVMLSYRALPSSSFSSRILDDWCDISAPLV
jgi:hypothetical protein